MSPRHALIFDFDGTLCDSFGAFVAIFNDMLKAQGRPVVTEEEIPRLRRMSPRELLGYFQVPVYQVPLMAARARRELTARLPSLQPFPGIRDAVHAAQSEGAAVGVVSSNSDENILQFAAAMGIRVDFVRGSISLLGKGRALRRALSDPRLGLTPARTAYVGDEVRDVDAARTAQVVSATVAWGYAAPEALRAAGPDFFLDSPDDVLRLAEDLRRR